MACFKSKLVSKGPKPSLNDDGTPRINPTTGKPSFWAPYAITTGAADGPLRKIIEDTRENEAQLGNVQEGDILFIHGLAPTVSEIDPATGDPYKVEDRYPRLLKVAGLICADGFAGHCKTMATTNNIPAIAMTGTLGNPVAKIPDSTHILIESESPDPANIPLGTKAEVWECGPAGKLPMPDWLKKAIAEGKKIPPELLVKYGG